MKKIFLVMTNTGTYFSKLIKKYTGDTYNHVSISLWEDLREMYSFGRRNPYIFFYGGFVIEKRNSGTFKRFKHTSAKVLELSVTEESYSILSECLARFIAEKKKFGYNFKGVLKARKNVNYQKTYRKFYCSQFVNYLLVCAHVLSEDYFAGIVKPEGFAKIEGTRVLYEGLLRDYAPQGASVDEVAVTRSEE